MTANTSMAGRVAGVRESLVRIHLGDATARRNEVAYVHVAGERLQGEVLRVRSGFADLQLFEDSRGVRVGDPVELTGELLSATLGPGLLGRVFDGLQNPLVDLHRQHGAFLLRGNRVPAVDSALRWPFAPARRQGALVQAGDLLGHVQEGPVNHPIVARFDMAGAAVVDWIADGMVDGGAPIAVLRRPDGAALAVDLHQRWPIRRPLAESLVRAGRCERLFPQHPLTTGIRLIDSFFPIARGGTACIPGPFGAGKTVLLNLIARYAEADVVVIVACGERAGEVTETLRTFPELTDPRTGRSLMERTVIVCNTSAMPVSARESSIHLGATIGEYYRQLGLQVLLLADSTSRWAQALRETSGFMEEIPGDEGFPAYLDSSIKALYERGGEVRTAGGATGSLTMIGTVSPAGGNLEEPVTQATLGTVKCFLGLSSERAYRRAYPAIDPLISWSRYPAQLDAWFEAAHGAGWSSRIRRLMDCVRAGDRVRQLVQVTGEEGITLADYILLLEADLIDTVFLQQNAMDPVDASTPPARQQAMIALLLAVIDKPWRFDSRDAARAMFLDVASLWRNLNASADGSADYLHYMEALREIVMEPADNCSADAAPNLQTSFGDHLS